MRPSNHFTAPKTGLLRHGKAWNCDSSMSYVELWDFYRLHRPARCKVVFRDVYDDVRGKWYQISDRNVACLQSIWERPSNVAEETRGEINFVREARSKSLRHNREWNKQHGQAPIKSLVKIIRWKTAMSVPRHKLFSVYTFVLRGNEKKEIHKWHTKSAIFWQILGGYKISS